MRELLQFILGNCLFLFDKNRYRFTNSEVSESFGGDALIVLESDTLRLRFVRDRGQLMLDVQAVGRKEWYSLDLLRRLILEVDELGTALLDHQNTQFLQDNLRAIERRLSGEELSRSEAELRKLKRKRAKEMFG